MNIRFALRLAWRESRASVRRLAMYMGAITLGVAALVAINSFRAGIAESIAAESRTLLGGDIRLSSGRPFPDSVNAVIAAAAAAGARRAHVTATLSVALAPNGNARLVQVRAVTAGFPLYGEVLTEPAGLWSALTAAGTDRSAAGSTGAKPGRDVLVDPALLIALDAKTGDTLRIGGSGFRISGVLSKPPVEIGFSSAIAPRVYIAAAWLGEAGLIRFGSLVTYQTYLAFGDDAARQRFVASHDSLITRQLVRLTTAQDAAGDLTEGFDWMARFLGLVGLTALLLGGLGVGSAVHVFVKERRPQIAVLRCLGATRSTAFLAYLFQATVLGLAGASLGVVLGIATQGMLPRLLGDAVPVTVPFRIYLVPVTAGLGVGVWVATLAALVPLLDVRRVPPLQALRIDVESAGDRQSERAKRSFLDRIRRPDALRLATAAAVLLSVVLLGMLQAPTPGRGIAFGGGLIAVALALRGVAAVLIRGVRRYLPRRAGFALRQGLSSLFRPSNQTTAVTVALGFGVFLIATLWIVQANLLARIRPPADENPPDLVAFDIQTDQKDDVARTFTSLGAPAPRLVPIVTARISRLRGHTVDEILTGPEAQRIEPWAVRREYRNTWRAELSTAEQLTAGEWWTGAPAADRLPRISVEEDLARTLRLQVGDTVTWDIQGRTLETRVASLRHVDWARFDTNFFVVFEPGIIDDAPQTWVTLAHVPDAATRAALQRELARRHPNVSTLDLSLVQQTVGRVINRITLAIRFMAAFVLVGGALVLAGALAAGRTQRTREAVLLRTLGATRRTVQRVLFTEYIALGSLAGLAGVLLGLLAGWALTRFFFEIPFKAPLLPLLLVWAGIATLAVLIGAANNRRILDRPPLAALREAL
jgi:putative ABC transport system permease protein